MARETYSFRLDRELIEQLDKIAEKETRSRANLVEHIIKQFVESYHDNTPGKAE
jgi:predicted transcriptional regulator